MYTGAPDLLNTQCILRLGNLDIPNLDAQFFCFCRPHKVLEHVENEHLRYTAPKTPFLAPLCDKVLEDLRTSKITPQLLIIVLSLLLLSMCKTQ
jgi:hypothetical protein